MNKETMAMMTAAGMMSFDFDSLLKGPGNIKSLKTPNRKKKKRKTAKASRKKNR